MQELLSALVASTDLPLNRLRKQAKESQHVAGSGSTSEWQMKTKRHRLMGVRKDCLGGRPVCEAQDPQPCNTPVNILFSKT